MELTLIRHAEAIDPEAFAGIDADRPLTDRGRARFHRAVRGLRALDWPVDAVFHSPWRRAVETAELLTPLNEGGLHPTDLLATSATLRVSAGLLTELAAFQRPAVVGHEPFLSELASVLLTGSGAASRTLALDWKKGGICRLTAPEPAPRVGDFQLSAFVPASALRLLGRSARRGR